MHEKIFICIAVNDSVSDIEVFEKCGKRIAINYSKSLINKADEYLITEDLKDILCLITYNRKFGKRRILL